MKKYNLEFCFKGNRTYIHGTDVYNKMLDFLKDKELQITNFDLSFHGIAKSNIEISDNKPTDETLLKFAFKYLDRDNTKKVFYGIENNIPVDCRYEYPEENICNLSELNLVNKEVVLNTNSSFTFIENVVALNKYLLENLFPDVNGKWYFTRLQMKELTNSSYPLKLVLKANFNFKLTKTEILIADKSIGFIYFSLI
jgi:hypothetical protein